MANRVLADDSDEAASRRVVRRVAEAANAEALELPPLYDAVDPDALDAVVDSPATTSVTFAYAGHTVSIDADGSVRLDPRAE